MALEKCPRCELNYILDGGKLCTVCRKEVSGEGVHDEMPEMCSECGENPAMPGGELCPICLKEIARRTAAAVSEDALMTEDPALEIDSMSNMGEIELELPDDDLSGEVFTGEEGFSDEDEDEEDEESEEPEEALLDDEDDYLEEDDYGDGDIRDC